MALQRNREEPAHMDAANAIANQCFWACNGPSDKAMIIGIIAAAVGPAEHRPVRTAVNSITATSNDVG